MPTDPDAPGFLEKLRNGDQQAFTQLVTLYHNRLLATARAMLGSADAEDAVQNAWIAAHRALPKFEGRSKLSTWLTRIVINEARMRMRRGGREINLDMDDEGRDALAHRFRENGHWQQPPTQWGIASPDELLTSDELAECLRKTLEVLPEKQRLVLELRDMQGQDFDAICNSLEISPSNVRVLLHRARTRLFALVDHFQETGEC